MKPADRIAGAPRPDVLTPAQAKLKQAAHQLEGVFLAQLFRTMRESVPDNGNEAQKMFTSMLDDTLASKAADHMQRGLGDALYRQLAQRLPKAEK